jgi:DNA-binding beta-propeller fold protein YncE
MKSRNLCARQGDPRLLRFCAMSPRTSRSALFVGAALVALAALGCGDTETRTEVVYTPYDGPAAYPNQRPEYPLPDGDLGVTSDNGSDTLTLIDFTSGQLLGSVPVGRDPVDNDGPHHIGMNRALGIAVVALAYPAPAIATGPHAAHGSSNRAGYVQKLSLPDFAPQGEVRVDTNPGDVVLSVDGSRAVVSHFELQKAVSGTTLAEKRSNLAIIDVASMTPAHSPAATRILTCVAPHGLLLSEPDGATAYVACYGEDAVAVVDTTDANAAVTYVPVGPGAGAPGSPTYGPYALAMNRARTFAAVSSTLNRDVRFFDVSARTMTGVAIPTLGAPFFGAYGPSDDKLYIPTQAPDELLVADPETGIVSQSLPLGPLGCILPHELVFSSDNATLYVVCEGKHGVVDEEPGRVLALDPESLELRQSFIAGIYPDRLLVLPAP